MRLNRLLLITFLLAITAMHPLHAADYFWVGGAGNWADISHWATTSGGTVQHSQIPTAKDRVFFDAQSFTAPGQVVVATSSIYCLDLNWTGVTRTPRFEAAEGVTLNVYGSLVLSTDMVFDFQGDILFQATNAGHKVDPGGHLFHRNTAFSGSGGGWTLTSAMKVDSILRFESGNFFSGNQPIQTEVLRILAVTSLAVDLGRSELVITGTAYFPHFASYIEEPIADISLTNLGFQGDSATIKCTAPNVFFRVRDNGVIQLGTLLFASTQGEGRLVQENPDPMGINYGKLELRCDAKISGVMQVDTLALGPGKNFTFEGGRTYPLRVLVAPGSCPTPIQLFSSTPGTAVYFRASAGIIAGDYLSLQDIHGIGGARFEAMNSADLGNNAGWVINPKANNKLYWVGDSGFWSDSANWALESGGVGGACVPTAADDVIFDAKSFSTPSAIVIADYDNVYCRSMDWFGATGVPVFKGSREKNIHIFGSLALIPAMQFEFEGDIFFESNEAGNTISSAGKTFQAEVTFNGSGSWLLSDSLSMVRDLFFLQGRLNTNSQAVYCQRFVSETNRMRELSLENSHVTLRTPDYQYLFWSVNGENYAFNAGSSTIEFKWYGDLRKKGNKALTYNRLIFRFGASVSAEEYQAPPTIIDTLTMYGGGSFFRKAQVHVWEVFRGNTYTINAKDTLQVDKIIHPADCNGMIEIASNVDNQTAFIQATQDNSLDRWVIQDVHEIGSGTLTVSNAVDMGNTTGWVLNKSLGRTLYWVGGSGSWLDPAHWSLTSGGTGGACVPTPVDDVFFDERSMTGLEDRIYTGDGVAYCRNLVWQNTQGQPFFNGNNLQLYGSMTLQSNIRSDYFNFLALRGRGKNNRIKTEGRIQFWIFLVRTPEDYILMDTLSTYYFEMVHGEFNSNGRPVEAEYVSFYNLDNYRRLRLGGSHWKVHGYNDGNRRSWLAYTPHELLADSSLVEFTHPNAGLYSEYSATFYNVLFSAETGVASVQGAQTKVLSYNRLEFRNNGVLLGKNIADSLIFAPGKSYKLDATNTQEVKELFQVIGNNCLSIELSSTQPGVKSRVLMETGQVLADFVQMRDQLAVGKTAFYAGVHSTDISNSNTGWIFDSAEDYIDEGILGQDVVLCKNSAVLLDARTYSPGETYRWNDGSTAPQFTTTQPGTFWVEVRYNENCTLVDSVRVLEAAAFQVDLPADTTLCAGESLKLDVTLDLLGLKYVWQDSSKTPTFTVQSPGKYRVELQLSGCTTADSLQVAYQPNPVVNLGADRTLCDGVVETLNASTTAATRFVWQDGATTPTYAVSAPGTYHVRVYEGRCVAGDTVQISYEPPLRLNLGKDTTICELSTLTLAPAVSGDVRYTWQDGSTASTLRVMNPGVYWVEAQRNNCSEKDSIRVNQQLLPRFELGSDTALCDGQQLVLQALTPAGSIYKWNTGASGSSIPITSTANYALTVTLNGCTFSDMRQVTFKPIPVLTLGPDQTPCPGEEIVLAPISPGATIKWQDGNTSKSFSVKATGLYWAEANLNGCTRRDSVVFTYKPALVVNLGKDTTLCAGQILPLQVAAQGATFRWSTGSTALAETIRSAGTYWLEADLNGCKVRDSIQVAYFIFPEDWLGADRVLCEGQTLRLSASTPGARYRWQDGTTAPVFLVSQAGTYRVEVQVGVCTQRDTVRVSYNPLPVFSLGKDTTLCTPELLTLRTPTDVDALLWSTGAKTAEVMIQQTGVIWAEVTRDGCLWRDSIAVRFQSAPRPALGQDSVICSKDVLTLQANVLAAQYKWQDGSTGASFKVTQPGVFTVTTSDGRCSASDTIRIDTRTCVEFKLFAPNAFSPNNDGINDGFIPQLPPGVIVLEYDLRVFDRWGNQVFQALDPAQAWDGTYRGSKMPQGTYVYALYIHYRAESEEAKTNFSGDVTLLR